MSTLAEEAKRYFRENAKQAWGGKEPPWPPFTDPIYLPHIRDTLAGLVLCDALEAAERRAGKVCAALANALEAAEFDRNMERNAFAEKMLTDPNTINLLRKAGWIDGTRLRACLPALRELWEAGMHLQSSTMMSDCLRAACQEEDDGCLSAVIKILEE